MSITAKPLIDAQFAPVSLDLMYSTPGNARTIIDKFTATNTNAATQTVTIHLVKSGDAAGASNIVTSAHSLTTGQSAELPELKNHILGPSDSVWVVASLASAIVVRASGREVV